MSEHRSSQRGRFERAVAELKRPVRADDLAVQRIMRAIRFRRPRMPLRQIALVSGLAAVVVLSSVLWRFTTNNTSNLGDGRGLGTTYVQFVYVGPRAQTVSLVGSFNDWDPRATPLNKDGNNGVWTAEIPLRPGHHEYSFNVDGRWVPDDDAPLGASDEFGAANSVIFVQ